MTVLSFRKVTTHFVIYFPFRLYSSCYCDSHVPNHYNKMDLNVLLYFLWRRDMTMKTFGPQELAECVTLAAEITIRSNDVGNQVYSILLIHSDTC